MSGHVLKRWLYLTHRWIGIVTCLLFAMWFASGLVMLYVPYPALDQTEWLEGQRPIDWSAVNATPQRASHAGAPQLRSLSLEMRGDEPVWRSLDWHGSHATYSASSGAPVSGSSQEEARQIAADFAGASVEALHLIHNDQWTVASRYDAHRPLWKADIAGDGGLAVYVSSQTGQVMLQTKSAERFWNWLGSVPHWIYPTVLRQDNEAWRQAVMWLSGPCIIAAITGIWIGILRVRLGKRRFKQGRISPYRGWMWWHHIPGMAGSLFLLLWIFSGWLSVDPGQVFASESPDLAERQLYAGPLPSDIDLARVGEVAEEARRVTLLSAAGRPFLRVEQPGREDLHLDSATLEPLRPDETGILQATRRLYPEHEIASVEILREPDFYWSSVGDGPPLPVLRARLDDRAETWLHIDPVTGEVLDTIDRRGRIYRTLYTLFHRWDLPILLENRPARDLLIWFFSLLGLITSVTGVKIAWARLRSQRPVRRGRRKPGRITSMPSVRRTVRRPNL